MICDYLRIRLGWILTALVIIVIIVIVIFMVFVVKDSATFLILALTKFK